VKPLKPQIVRLITALVIVTGVAILVYRQLTGSDLFAALLRVGSFASLLAVPLWILYDRVLWGIPFFRAWGYFCDVPDLRGRWAGIIDRGDSRGAHRFVLEIAQTMTEIHCITYSSRSLSRSLTAEIVCESKHKQALQLIYTWRAEVREELDGTPLPDVMFFDGTTILDIHLRSRRCLEGRYYSNRQPNSTRGRLDLKYERRDLSGEF
jgi:predicted pore-forming effector associated with SMODS systems